jgi:hypothetical protein
MTTTNTQSSTTKRRRIAAAGPLLTVAAAMSISALGAVKPKANQGSKCLTASA